MMPAIVLCIGGDTKQSKPNEKDRNTSPEDYAEDTCVYVIRNTNAKICIKMA